LTFLNILELEGAADIQAKLKELDELNQSLGSRDKSETIQEIKRSQIKY
jgi:hypothetical protein